MKNSHIFATLFNAPMMYHPRKAAAVAQWFGQRATGRGVDLEGATPLHHMAFERGRPSMGILGDRLGRGFDRTNRKPYDQIGHMAVMPIEGSLVHKGAWVESDSGETSYQGLQTQIQRLRRDDSVKSVAVEVDSFGGMVSGAFETADMLHQLSLEKPTMAILTENAYSAGYLLASACRSIIIPETGGAGSIGVISLHVDQSRRIEEMGLKVTILAAGAHKADGNPYEALPDDVATRWRAELENMRKVFAGRVATYRGKRLSFEQAMATEALDYTGAAAVKAGLADATGQPLEAFQAFYSQTNRA